jgi:hypothetical protein
MVQEEKSNLHAVIAKQPEEESSERSEEMQSIIERMPTRWTKWVALCVGVLMGVIPAARFLIQYPDTADGQILVTAVTSICMELHVSLGNIMENNHSIRSKKETGGTSRYVIY